MFAFEEFIEVHGLRKIIDARGRDENSGDGEKEKRNRVKKQDSAQHKICRRNQREPAHTAKKQINHVSQDDGVRKRPSQLALNRVFVKEIKVQARKQDTKPYPD